MSYASDVLPASAEDLARIMDLARKLQEAEDLVADRERLLAAAKEEARRIAEVDIPEIADRIGNFEFKLSDGSILKVEDVIHASISEANGEAAYRWLEENGHDGLIKRQIVVAFRKEQTEDARELEEELRREFENVKTKMDVHNSTLKAWVRGRLERGAEIPTSITVDARKVAKIKIK